MFAYCLNNPIYYVDDNGMLTSPPDPVQKAGAELGKLISDFLQELFGNDKDTIEQQEIEYSVSSKGKGGKVTESYRLKTFVYQYVFIMQNRGEEIRGTTTGVVFEWFCHNAMYEVAGLFTNFDNVYVSGISTALVDMAKSVEFGRTIWGDIEDHNIASAPMLILYTYVFPGASVVDLVIEIMSQMEDQYGQ